MNGSTIFDQLILFELTLLFIHPRKLFVPLLEKVVKIAAAAAAQTLDTAAAAAAAAAAA